MDTNGNLIDLGSSSSEEEGPPDIFKVKKANLPPVAPPPLLRDCLGAIRSDIIAETKSNLKKVKKNMTNEEYEALEALKRAQKSGEIVIKEADKSGGICIMNQKDYLDEIMLMNEIT